MFVPSFTSRDQMLSWMGNLFQLKENLYIGVGLISRAFCSKNTRQSSLKLTHVIVKPRRSD